MGKKTSYGQYCPLSMSAEILCNRWTILIIREMLAGSTGFNEICRGVPLMSRTLLSSRLKELESAGLVTVSARNGNRRTRYRLSPAGEALGPVVFAVAGWGQQWIDVEPSVDMVDTDFLMWDIRRNVRSIPELPDRFVVLFHFPDAPEKKQMHWLVFEQSEVDLCYIDPGYDVDVEIEASMKNMVKVWMGWTGFATAVSEGDLVLNGPYEYTHRAKEWLGLSSVSHIKKQPEELRALRPV